MNRAAAEETEYESLKETARNSVDEARMVLPGIQAVFGFQLIAVFNERFAQTDFVFRLMHWASIVAVVIAIALIMTPAVYHRTEGVREVSERFLRNSTRLLVASMVVLGVALCLDYYVVGRLVLGSAWAAAPAAALFGVFTFFWIVLPRSNALKSMLDSLPRAKAERASSRHSSA